MEQTNAGSGLIDGVVNVIGGIATFCGLWYSENIPLIHVHFPPIVLEIAQLSAWGMTSLVGGFTLLNFLGIEPEWLKRIKNYNKNKNPKQTNMKASEHFEVHEFIDPVTFAELGDKAIEKIDKKMIVISELLRAKTGKAVTINNWHSGGQYHESGTRRDDTKTGASKSAHKMQPLCQACDYKVAVMTAEEVHKVVLDNEEEFYNAGVRQMEDLSFTPSWTHLASRGPDRADKKIVIIKP